MAARDASTTANIPTNLKPSELLRSCLTRRAAQHIRLGQLPARGSRVHVLCVELDEPGFARSRVAMVVSDGDEMTVVEVAGMPLSAIV